MLSYEKQPAQCKEKISGSNTAGHRSRRIRIMCLWWRVSENSSGRQGVMWCPFRTSCGHLLRIDVLRGFPLHQGLTKAIQRLPCFSSTWGWNIYLQCISLLTTTAFQEIFYWGEGWYLYCSEGCCSSYSSCAGKIVNDLIRQKLGL